MRLRLKNNDCPSIILVLLLGVVALGQTASAPSQPTVADADVDRILTRLEQRDVHDLRGDLVWRQQDILPGFEDDEDSLTKRGEIWYQQADPVARFLIHFKESIAGTRKDQVDERHVFDGRWYVELQSRTKTMQRREVRRADDPGDPYKVGEGIFPLPFGQKKADILREFEARLVAPDPKDPSDTDHLCLTPRAATQTDRSYKQLDFWIVRTGSLAGLPVKVRVAKKDGTGRVRSHITIVFDKVRLNEGFEERVFEIQCPRGYEELPPERLDPVPAPRVPGDVKTPAGSAGPTQ